MCLYGMGLLISHRHNKISIASLYCQYNSVLTCGCGWVWLCQPHMQTYWKKTLRSQVHVPQACPNLWFTTDSLSTIRYAISRMFDWKPAVDSRMDFPGCVGPRPYGIGYEATSGQAVRGACHQSDMSRNTASVERPASRRVGACALLGSCILPSSPRAPHPNTKADTWLHSHLPSPPFHLQTRSTGALCLLGTRVCVCSVLPHCVRPSWERTGRRRGKLGRD
ncbi:hypothetical protein F5Y05DRAFT_312882 [Hypoxylon sp. FL0543]|nr:hypothetical protein F5Y05DRAFT_312882 [Hypoxylon sp. FL0543]